jgi:DNA-binding XRE family transcriptional regulator
MSNDKNNRVPASSTHDEMVAEWMKEPAFRAEFNVLEEEFQLLREMLHARKRAGLTQEDVAMRMGTKAPAIARLEASGARDKSSPSVSTLRKYAHAVGCTLEIHLKPFSKKDLKVKHA